MTLDFTFEPINTDYSCAVYPPVFLLTPSLELSSNLQRRRYRRAIGVHVSFLLWRAGVYVRWYDRGRTIRPNC